MIGTAAAQLLVAGLVGLAVGFERERSGHATGPTARFAGLRTFFLIGLVGGTAGLVMRDAPGAAAALLAAAGGLIVASYVIAVRRPESDLDGTTESAALVVLALGLLSGLGQRALASAAAVVVVVALSEKTRLHSIVHRPGAVDLRAGLQFAVLAVVVLPLLPEGPYGPLGGIRPRALWIAVLLFSALNFAGYVARRAVGPRRGYVLLGLIGGLVSSTALTLQFARKSRELPALSGPLALGTVAAWTMVLPRVALISAALNASLAVALTPYLLPAVVLTTAVGLVVARRSPALAPTDSTPGDSGSPLRLWTAIQLAVALQVVLTAMVVVRSRLGPDAVLATAAVLGLVNVDALTFAMSRLGTTPEAIALAARAVGIGLVATTLWKGAAGLALGAPRFRAIVTAGVIGLVAALGVGFALARSSAAGR